MSEPQTKTITYEGNVELDQAVSYLENLARSLRSGTVKVEHGGEHITLQPASVIKLEVEARQKRSKESLEFQLSWRQAPEPVTSPPLQIRSEAPASPSPGPGAGISEGGQASAAGDRGA